MSETHNKGTYYFQSYLDYFWQWEVDYMFSGTVIDAAQDYHGGINCISIPDGMTVAYKEQIEEVLRTIAPYGFPPFGALVLTFLATNSGEVRYAIDEIFKEILQQHTDFPTVEHIDFTAAQSFLRNLIALPTQYKKGKNRLELFAFLFETANHSLSAKYADEIFACIKNADFELNTCSQKLEITVSTLSKDFNALALLHKKYPTVDALLKAWLKLEEVPVEPEETAYFSEDPDLIQELIEEPKTFFMGSLIKRIWSGIQLPMHYVHPGEMPLGGISDITNKGKFDNILLSEFANDDLIFLHRIANKEALFIRRETTPEEDLRTRIFLIDTTIKNWGTPKILSFATAFSLIHHPKNEMHFQPYALGETFQEIAFDTKLNILQDLQITSPLLDAANAIEEFIQQCEDENIEITLFTSPKTLEHAEIRKIFNKYHDKFGGVITADVHGNIDVYRMKSGSKRLVKHIQLPLDELWKNPPRRKIKRSQTKKSGAYEKVVNYPFLYGYPTRGVVHFSDENFTYILQKNGDLFRSRSRSKGYEMILSDIRFITGIKQQKMALLYENEFMIAYWNSDKHMIFKSGSSTSIYKEDMSEFSNVVYKNLLAHDDEIYLVTRKYYSGEPIFTRFDIEDKTYEKIEMPSSALRLKYKSYLSNYLGYFEGSIFSKINSITITTDLEIIFNFRHRLDLLGDTIYFEMIDKYEAHLEDEFTMYVNRRKLQAEFNNGSKIKIDRNGVIIFESNDPEIPTFYLSSYIGVNLAVANEEEFAGSDYFYPENGTLQKIAISDFNDHYIEPYLRSILYE